MGATQPADPLAAALARKTVTGEPGVAAEQVVASGDGWRVVDVVCTSGPRDRAFEECSAWATVSLVLSGTFGHRSDAGPSLLSPGALLLMDADRPYECSHVHGEGDRCLSFQLDRERFERLAADVGAGRRRFARHHLPPLRPLAPLVARFRHAADHTDGVDEAGLELAAAAVRLASDAAGPSGGGRHHARVARVLRRCEADIAARLTLDDLAAEAGLSPFHFLRAFREVTGVTPHQWILRARLREAARRLVATRAPVTDVALDVGFDDLSNFIRTFRSEFGVSPSRYR